MTIIDRPSPNFNARPAGVRPDAIIIHGTAGTGESDLAWLCDPKSRVSYHYDIVEDGRIFRLVRPELRAWHAGESTYGGRKNVNDYSIGVGLSNPGDGRPFTPAQYTSAGWLCEILLREWTIQMARILGHYHVSPGRKTDPWFSFEWMRLAVEIERAR